MKKLIFGTVGVVLLVCIITLLGWFAPITVHTPIFLMNTRPELRAISKNLYVGQGFWVHIPSPFLTEVCTPAWKAESFAYGMQKLSEKAKAGEEVFYPLYTEEEIKEDERRGQVSVYRLSADNSERRPYVILLAGGGFQSVCTPMESLPVAAAFNDMGYTAFCLTYRVGETFGEEPDTIAEDIAKGVEFITANAEAFNVETNGYLIGGFSAGGMAISKWCNPDTGYEKYGLPKPGAACFIYGMNESYAHTMDVPSFILACEKDEYFTEGFAEAADTLESRGIPTQYKTVDALHGFGLGTGTEAEGWVNDAEAFWKEHNEILFGN